MAIEINDGGTNYIYNLSGGLPDFRNPFDWMSWIRDRTTSHDGNGSYFFAGNGGFDYYLTNRVNSGGVELALAAGQPNVQDDSGVNVEQNTWKHHRVFRTALSGDLVYQINLVEVARVTFDATSEGAMDNVSVGIIHGTGLLTYADYAFMRLYETMLTEEEAEAEYYSETAVKTSDLYDAWQFSSGALLDGAHNGHDWTAANSPGFIADPVLPTPPGGNIVPLLYQLGLQMRGS